MKLFKVLVRDGEESYILGKSKESVLSYFSDTHVMDCIEVKSFIDTVSKEIERLDILGDYYNEAGYYFDKVSVDPDLEEKLESIEARYQDTFKR